MNNSKRITDLICLMGWPLNIGLSIGDIINGTQVHPITVLLPSLVCVFFYARSIMRTCIQDDEQLIKEIL